MVKRTCIAPLVVLVCVLLLAGGALAANGVAIERSVIAGGGERVTDGSLYVLDGTIGEPVASALTLDTSYGLGSGFWWPHEYRIFLPLVMRNF
jgi:hypothetical protein